MINCLIKNLKLVKEGNSLRDKFTLLWYSLTLPFNYLRILFGGHLSKKLIFDVIVKNNDGVFHCKRDIGLVQTASQTYEPNLRKYFNLTEGAFFDVGANIGKYTIAVGNKLKQG